MMGRKFGRWTVIREGEATRNRDGSRRRCMFCRCDCGAEKLVRLSLLRNRGSRSCGCLKREVSRKRGAAYGMRVLVNGFLGWTTEFLNFIPVGDTYALVDEADFAELSQINWNLRRDSKSGTYYARTDRNNGNKRPLPFMHQQILQLPDGFEIDHKNHNGLDNRRENLRAATGTQNQANRRKRGSDGTSSTYKGVSKQGQRWRARLSRHGELYHLGYFSTEDEAAVAYNKSARKLFGEFALTNKVSSLSTDLPNNQKEAVQS